MHTHCAQLLMHHHGKAEWVHWGRLPSLEYVLSLAFLEKLTDLCFCFLFETISLRARWPLTHNLRASTSWVLGFQYCATTPHYDLRCKGGWLPSKEKSAERNQGWTDSRRNTQEHKGLVSIVQQQTYFEQVMRHWRVESSAFSSASGLSCCRTGRKQWSSNSKGLSTI